MIAISQLNHVFQIQPTCLQVPNREPISLLTPVTFGIYICVVLVACMTDSHAYSYLHMAQQNEVCLLAADFEAVHYLVFSVGSSQTPRICLYMCVFVKA